MNATIIGSIAALFVGGALSTVSVLGAVDSQVNGDADRSINVSSPIVPYGDSE